MVANPNKTVDEICAKARSQDSVKTHGACYTEIKQEAISAIKSSQRHRYHRESEIKVPMDNKKCFACGFDYPHKTICPAKDKKSRVCDLVCHFGKTKMCKGYFNKRCSGVKAISSRSEEKGCTDEVKSMTSDRQAAFGNRKYLFAHGSGSRERPSVNVYIYGQRMEVLIDSGQQKMF